MPSEDTWQIISFHSNLEKPKKLYIVDKIDLYLASPCVAGEIDPFVWWKFNAVTFPQSACMAEAYLSVTVSSSPSEWKLSSDCPTLTNYCEQLTPEHFQATVFLQIWTKIVMLSMNNSVFLFPFFFLIHESLSCIKKEIDWLVVCLWDKWFCGYACHRASHYTWKHQ